MASMPLTGTIGATGESGSYRRALPDQVTSFVLPTVERPKEQLARLHMPKQQRGRRSNAAAAKQQQQESVADVVNDEDDGLLSIESSMTLLQSLRQSRLTHLTALLPYLSTRHRTSTKYHAAPAGMVYPGGMDPTASPPPTLLHLGRADVRVGPFVFPRTRFGEARVEGVVFESTDAATTAAAPTATPTTAPAQPANGKMKEVASASEAIAGSSITSEPVAQTSTPAAATRTASTPVRASKPPPKSAASASATPGSSAPASAAASPSRTSGPATPAVSTPAAAAAAAPINDKVVKAVSAAAQRDPALQRLLHAAANGKATAEQLRELAAFIAKVSEGLEKEAQSQHREAQRILDAAAGIITPSPVTAKASSSSTAQPAAPKKVKKRKVRVSTGSDAPATSNANEANASRIPAPSSAYTAVPPYPPIVTIEYREHPSARFVLPLWRGATVERRVDGGERSIKVSMLLPAIGSSAALRAGGAQDEAEEAGKSKGKGAAQKAAAAQGSAAAASLPPSAQAAAGAASPRKLPTLEELNAPAPAGAETRALTWFITGTSETPLSDGIWFVFGRVDGATTFVDGILHADAERKPHPMESLSEQVLSALISKVRLLSSRMTDCQRTPKLRVTADEIPSDLPDHLADRFAPRMQTLASRPMVRIKRVGGGTGDDGEEQFEIVRSTAMYADAKPSKRARFDDDDGDTTTMTWDGGDDSFASVDASGKPKRKRHVAKFNPDGTLKLCQACGTNSTPMWRRGPAGKSTLCNACGAKWKVGRLVVPDQPPTKESVVATSPRKTAQKIFAKDDDKSKKDAEASSIHARQNGNESETAPSIAVADDTPQTAPAPAPQDTAKQATPAT